MIFLPNRYPSVDFVYNILGLGFYGESQGTGTLSENYFEYEEDDEKDFTEEQQDSTESNIISLDDIDSPDYVSAGTPVDKETIYLQSNEGKKSIVTSLSDILKQVISFISQKFKAIFNIL